MPTLTQQELTEIAAIIPATYEDFEQAYWTAKAGEDPTPAEEYYQYLADKGFGYGNAALGVVRNDTGKGQIANLHAEKRAGEDSVDLSFESDNWLEVQYELMVGDKDFRVANGGNDLSFQNQLDNHANAHAEVGAPAETFTSHVPLTQVAEFDPVLAQALWEEIIDDDGIADSWLEDGLKLGFNANIAAQQSFPDLLEDYAAQAAWYGRLALAIRDLGSVELAELYNELGQDFEDSVEGFIDFVDDLFGQDDPVAQPWLQGLLDIPGLRDLPGWLDDALTPFDDAKTTGSPLVVDLDSDGVELTTFNAASTTTFFDIDGDGFAEQTAWVSDDDGLLVRDLNENGTIDDVDELFGSMTIDGFALLAQMDTNGDLVIDASDADWGDLRIWQDANNDAVTQEGELLTLASLDIESISLLNVAASTSTISGNPISHTSTFKYENGSTDDIVDAWFVHDNVNTFYAGDYTLDPRALFLPTLRGFGELADLHIAMSADATLLGLVEDFVLEWSFSKFSDLNDQDGDLEDILFNWAGVEGVSPTSRGWYVDAQHLEFLEEYFGEEYLQNGASSNPYTRAGAFLEESWDIVFKNLKAHVLIQTGADALFANPITYNPSTGEFEGTFALSQTAVDDLVDYATDTGVSTLLYWVSIAEFIDATMGLASLTGTEEGWLNTALDNSGLSESWADVEELHLGGDTTGSTTTGTSANETINGTGLDDTLTGGGTDTINGGDGDDWLRSHTTTDTAGDTLNGGNGHDLIQGRDGNDTIDGGAGNDEIDGGAGNDVLTGGTGGDIVEGGIGSDTYVYTAHDDVYYDDSTSSADKILMPAGIDANDLTYARLGAGDLLITVSGLGTILLEAQLNNNTAGVIETIEFNDTSTLNLLTIATPETHGTEGNDTLLGLTYGTADEDDVIYGYGGDDEIWGSGGNNWIDGGAGNDLIVLGGAALGETNTIVASPGFDVLQAHVWSDDIILIPEPYSTGDVELFRYASSQDDLYILISGLGQIKVTDHFYYSTGTLDEIAFADASPSVDISTVQFTLYGTSGNDTLNGIIGGGSLDDIIYGYAGNDTINGDDGDDMLYGGAGNDTVDGGNGEDTFFYEGGNDTFGDFGTNDDIIDIAATWTFANLSFHRYVDGDTDDMIIEIDGSNSIVLDKQFTAANGEWETLRMHDGSGDINIFNDIVAQTHGTSGNNTINGITFGASNDDIMYGLAGIDTLNGSDGDDLLYGGDGNDTVNGGNDNDTLSGDAGDDTLNGSAGNDTYIYSAGLDTVTDTGGTEVLWITGGTTINDITVSNHGTDEAKVVVTASSHEVIVNDLRNASASKHVETIKFDDGFTADLPSYNSWLNGTSGDDTVSGNSSANVLIGFAGNDTITGDGGADNAHGGDGTDTIDGGSGADLLYGGSGNDSIKGGTGADVMNGGDGTDTADYSGDGAAVSVNLATGAATDGNSDSDTLSNFENVTGSAYNDTITGNSGNNTLDGGAGIDTLAGGLGDDTYITDTTTDTITENAGEGNDTIRSSVTRTIAALANIENITLTGSTAINATGNAGGNTLDGSQNTAVNALAGGAGDDTYIVGIGDTVTEAASGGIDTVRSATAWTLGANLENLVLTGTGAVAGTGNTLANTLDGSLNTAANALSGGTGNDTYIVGAGDTVTEAASAGTDTVRSGVSFTLGANVENLNLLGTTAITGTGNTLANTIDGSQNSAANALAGGTGNDTYIVGAGDTVTEAASAGTDAVQSSVSFTLGTNVENLTLLGLSNINATGNTQNNILTGNSGNNVMNGNTGTDTLAGGLGDDTYVVDSVTDIITENASAGIDTISSSVTFTIASLANVENISLTGATAVNATGNASSNVLTGNNAANTLTGSAGADTLIGSGGADILWGGTEQDTFKFDLSAIGSIDTIKDYSSAQADRLDIKDILVGYDPAASAITNFLEMTTVGANTVMKADRDGTGSTYGWQQIATIEGVTGLTDEAALLANGTLIAA